MVILGYKGQFTVAAEGEGLQYQWQYKRPDSDNWANTTLKGYDSATLEVQATKNRNGYSYRCVILGLDGTETVSESIVLTVK